MNILITVNKNFAKQANVLLNSIQYSNTKEKFAIYVLHRDLEENDLKTINNNLNLKQFQIHLIHIPENEILKFPVYEKRYPLEIYFRIFASKYLPQNLKRILYLDADTLVINSLKELYETEFDGNYYIATTHIKKVLHKLNEIRLNIKEDEPYINTGVLLMNLEALRKINIEKEVKEFVKENEKKLLLPDQDIIVSIYGDKIKLVDSLKYNLGERTLNTYNINHPQNPIGLKWICKNTVIIHYYGRNKPWNKQYIGKLNCFYNKIEKMIQKNLKEKVLILSCGTGGGHNSAARAIQENLIDRGIETDFIEYLDIINPRVRNRVNKLYISSTRKNGKVFKVVYKLGEIYQKTNLKSPVYALNFLNKKRLYKYIIDNNYKYIITTHLFAGQSLTAIKKEHDIKFMAIATDYVCIPFWEETNPDYFVIPSEELKEDFKSKGIPEERLLPFGIPTAKVYREEYDKKEYKEKLNFKVNEKYILILTGSMGFGNITEMINKMQNEIKNVNFIVSCGHNEEVYNILKERCKNTNNIIILPFTNNISNYMKASDIILSKPGGLTTTEIATLRKPFIHTMPIPGCENYNAKFFESRNMSIKCDTIEEVIQKTKKLLKDKTLQNQMIENQKKYIKKDACDKISDVVIREMQ